MVSPFLYKVAKKKYLDIKDNNNNKENDIINYGSKHTSFRYYLKISFSIT